MSSDVIQRIRELLRKHGIPFREIHHEATHTSEESARARGEDLRTGAKAIVLKVVDTFRLFVLPADGKLDSAAIKQHFSIKKSRFATPEELFNITGLVPGSVPPFGSPILDLPLYADPSTGLATGRVAFNAGSLTDSIIMSTADWMRIAAPVQFRLRLAE